MFILFLLSLSTINVESKIDSVIVFSDRAVIVRKATVTLSGSETIRFPELSGMLDDNTVRVKSDGLRIGEVQIRRGYIEKPIGRVKVLKDSIKLLEDKVRNIENNLKVLEAKESFLNSVKLGSPEIINKELITGKISPDAWRQALSFVAEELTLVKSRQIEFTREKEDITKKLDALRRELSDIQAKMENRKEVIAEVEAQNPDTYPIELSYVIPYAVSWVPYYELRADPSAGNVEISYFAKISQRTGEDWERTKLVISTAAPALAGVAPEPYPWLVSIEEPKPIATRTAVMSEEAIQYAAPMEAAKADIAVPRIETGISLQYVIAGRISLQSGEPAKKFSLYRAKLPAEFEYYTLPKAQELAYLKGRLKNTSDYVFLRGEANTYVGGEFTGKTDISTIAPEESTEISFGTDERVKIKRELIRTFITSSGLFGKRERREFIYKTTVENLRPREIEIKLIEQIPVSQHKDVEIKVIKIEPKGYEEDKNLGTFTWRPKLVQQQKFIVELNYYVEYPKGKIVTGLY
ncbi:MAG: mucoidy inhibitor MuiA family protein [candidate division WOR-3 bacterium]|nr:mucoidy inhibitor MuiA family protein [candidate division WOR-3 bacterium]